jgi:hypothetical protein
MTPPNPDRVFHPKIWVIRFADARGRTLHRFLCLSRNLTFERSWDTLLRLDEFEESTGATVVDTEPLAEFVERLPILRATARTRASRPGDRAGHLAALTPLPIARGL